MTQTLFVRVKNADGKAVERRVKIIRSWQDADGRQIYLHHNGIYGYKDGQPVTGPGEFNLIGDPVQRSLAMKWWKHRGKKLSREHYAALDNARRVANLRGLPNDATATSDLDAVQYIRRPIKNRSRSAFCDPTSWYEWFDNRPDWWGHALVIEMAGYRYERCDNENDSSPDPADSDVKTNDPDFTDPDDANNSDPLPDPGDMGDTGNLGTGGPDNTDL